MGEMKLPLHVIPGPWGDDIADRDDILICEMIEKEEPQSWATEIVNAVNAYPKLIAACEDVLESITITRDIFGDTVARGVFEGAFSGVEEHLCLVLEEVT